MITEAIVSSLAEALISSSISLIPKLLTFMGKGVSEVQHWESLLGDLLAYLEDAEVKKQDSPRVASWLEEVEDWCYDLEDILDELHYEASRQKIEFPGSGSCWSKTRSFPRNLRINFHVSRKLGAMTQRLQNMKDRLETLNLIRSSVPTSSSTQRSTRRNPGVSVLRETIVMGRDEEKETIIGRLLAENEGDDKLMVIPIVGMGGLGKTTLARYVYHDPRVESSFEIRGWVCISSDYNITRISKEILESVNDNCGEVARKSLDWIQTKLGQALRNKKFLLVLDDNWNDEYGDWNALRAPFLQGSCGSRIIVTTRSHHVANTVRTGTVDSTIPRHLSDDDCWSLLCSHAALDEKTDSFMRLQEIGRKIAQKCSGLPLAAMTIGGLLRYKSSVEQWEAILESKSWMSKGGDNIMSVLRMSYDDLDSQLKRCFSFLAVFPEDYRLEKEEVVLLWVGAGLIQLEEEGDSKIKMGHEVFDGLVSRSLLLQRDNYFIMHDLVRDLAKRISGKNCLTDEWCKSARHVSYYNCENKDMVDRILKEKRKAILPLRSIVGLSQEQYFPNDLLARLKFIRIFQTPWDFRSESGLPKSIGKLALLRYLEFRTGMCGLPTSFTSLYNLEILRLKYSSLEQLPERIGNLANLCYLDLSNTMIQTLPSSFTSLRRLETLLLERCRSFQQLPEGIGNLVNLRHLDLSCSEIQTLPSSFTSLRRLETLLLKCCSSFQQLPEGIGNLVNLCHLDLTVTEIQTLPSSLTSLNKLETLILEHCDVLKQLPEGIEELRTLRSLSNFIIGEKLPLSSLHKMKNLRGSLEISNLLDAASPEDARLAQLSEIKLERLSLNWSTFSLISVSGSLDIAEGILQHLRPNEDLKELVIRNYVGSKLPTWLAGSLRYLAVLELKSCYSCTSQLEAMASLEKLHIIDCPEMTVFMGRMPRTKAS